MPVSRLWCIDTTAPKSGSGCRAPAATRDRAFWRSWAETKTARGRSKHDGIQNFTTSLNPANWSRQVPIGRLGADLSSGHVPAFSWVIPDECHDQHGDPPYCIDSGTPGGSDPQDQRLVAVGTSTSGSWSGRSPTPASGQRATTPSTSSTTRATPASAVAARSPTSSSPATARGTCRIPQLTVTTRCWRRSCATSACPACRMRARQPR